MSSPKITFIDIYRRSGNSDTKSVQIFIGNNPDFNSDSWVKNGEGDILKFIFQTVIELYSQVYSKYMCMETKV